MLCRWEGITREQHGPDLAALTQSGGQSLNKSKSSNPPQPLSWDDLCLLALMRIQLEESRQNIGLVSGDVETLFLALHRKLYPFLISVLNFQCIHVRFPSSKV